MKTPSRLLLVALLLLLGSCNRTAEDRARDDERVGHARSSFMDVDVDGGVACIRSIEAGALRLRAQTPTFSLRARVGTPTVRLTIDNLMADATLSAGQLVEATGRSKTWLVDAPNGELVAELHVPDESAPTPFRFALLADVQEDVAHVGDIYARINEDPTIRFVLFSGDLTQIGDEAELLEFERQERTLRIPLYATLGNHELNADEVYFQRIFGRGNYQFVFHDFAFTVLDSASATIDPRAYGWLDDWLASSRGRGHIVTMHIPPLDPVGTRSTAFANRGEGSMLLARLAEAGVDLTLYGHVHSYYAFENAGIPAYISGGGGAAPERLDGIGRNYLTVDVDPARGAILDVGVVRID